MIKFLEDIDRHITEGLEIGRKFKAPAWGKAVSKILFVGMGGSAIGGDVLRVLVTAQKPMVFEVNRTGRFPAWVDSSTLVVLSSYSGFTPETLANVQPAKKNGAKIIVLTSGGKLLEAAKKNKIPYLQVPGGLPPRCAIGYLAFALIPVFHKWGWLKFGSAEQAEVLKTIRTAPRSKAKDLAKRLHEKSVHFYGFSGFAEPVVTRWRAQFAENSKVLASSHLIPEMMHNEVEAWKFPEDLIRKSAAVFFKDKSDLPWLGNKIKAVQKVFSKTGADVIEIPSTGKSLAARLFSLIILADWVSFELAALNETDPVRIPTIELLKQVR